MFARGQLRHDSSVLAVRSKLRSDNGRPDRLAVLDNSCGSFVARSFDSQDQHWYRECLDLAQFNYDLPQSLIAQEPLPDRAAARMLVLYRREQRWEDRVFRDL